MNERLDDIRFSSCYKGGEKRHWRQERDEEGKRSVRRGGMSCARHSHGEDADEEENRREIEINSALNDSKSRRRRRETKAKGNKKMKSYRRATESGIKQRNQRFRSCKVENGEGREEDAEKGGIGEGK